MITALSFHGLVLPPHCNASSRVVIAPAESTAPRKSIRAHWRASSGHERSAGSEPSGGEALRKRVTTARDKPPMGRFL